MEQATSEATSEFVGRQWLSDLRTDACEFTRIDRNSLLIHNVNSQRGFRMARKRKKKLPDVGSVYVFPFGNGLFSACRVLQSHVVENINEVLVACSRWVGDRVPDKPTAEMREILVSTYFDLREELKLTWAHERPPNDFLYIGMLPPSEEDSQLDTTDRTGWGHFPYAAYTQWRWENERESLLAEKLAAEQEARAESLKAREEDERARGSLTLDHFVDYVFFEGWTDYPSKRVTRAARSAMQRLVNELVKLGSDAPVDQKTAAVKSCILSFNEMNDKFGDFMDTMIREDVSEEVWRIAYASGLGDIGEQMDEWILW